MIGAADFGRDLHLGARTAPVAADGFSYMQMVLGFSVGAAASSRFVLIPSCSDTA